jgi:putative MATE family efflux protein
MALWAITWPIFVEHLFRTLPGMVDTLMVSQLGDSAVAGLAVANQIVIFFIILFLFVGIGSSVVITHYLGARDHAGAQQVASNAIAVNFWMGVVVSVLIYAFSTDMLKLMHLPPGLMPYAQPFLALMGGTLFLEALNIVFCAILRAHGHTRDAMVVTVSMNIINLGLNFVLIFGMYGFPKLGVVGAAMSTIISRLIACIFLAWLVQHRTDVRLRIQSLWHLSRNYLSKILHIGSPAAGENLSYWTSFMVITYFVGQMGETALATFAYTMQLVTVMMILSTSIGFGTEIMIGHMVGAGEIEAAYKQLLRSLRLGLALTISVLIVGVLLSKPLFSIFTTDPSIIIGGSLLLTIGLILEPGRTFNLIVINALRAAGDARFPVLMGMCSMWGVAVPLAWFLGLHLQWGLPGVWVAFASDEWLRGIMMYLRWKSRSWEKYANATRAGIVAKSLNA